MLRKLLAVSFFALVMVPAWADLRFDVTNSKHELLQKVVHKTLSAEELSDNEKYSLQELIPGKSSVEVPCAIERNADGTAVLSWVMPGITSPGITRSFVLKSGMGQAASSDLTAVEKDGCIQVSNQYYYLEHPIKGNGGAPRNIRFRLSGNVDSGLYLFDRLFTKDLGMFSMVNDKGATARIVSANAFRVVVESKFRYAFGGKDTPGNSRGVYRYVYSAYSPVVEVYGSLEKDNDQPWAELHFLHLTRKDRLYDYFVTGDAGKKYEILPKGRKSVLHHGKDWAVMASDSDAAGVGGGPVVCWDASSEFFYYLRLLKVKQWKERHVEMNGKLYFGPSSSDNDWYSRWLSEKAQPVVTMKAVTCEGTQKLAPLKGELELTSGSGRIVFAGPERGFAVLGVEGKNMNARFCDAGETAPPMWQLEFRKGGTKDGAVIIHSSAAKGVAQKNGQNLVLKWDNVPLGAGQGDISVTVNIKMDGLRSQWRMSVQNNSKELGLWESNFPVLGRVIEPGNGDTLLPTGNWGGSLYHNKACSFATPYPSGSSPVQFMAFMQNGAGLYFAAHDGSARAKTLTLSPSQNIAVKLPAENMGVPGSGRGDDFPVIVELFNGNWWNAAKIYRKWALKQPWTAKGPIISRTDYPKQLTDLGFWMLLNGASSQILSHMENARVLSNAPTGVHWYCWHKIPFDNSYPEYFPVIDGMSEATRAMTAKGQLVMPYINGRLWDRDIDSFKAAEAFSCMDETGKPYIETYGSGRFLVPMCPYTSFWQDKINEICLRMVTECGVNGIYLDQIGAARPKFCFNPKHGHPLGGGSHWVDGYRVMLNRTKAMAQKNGVTLTTENTAEPYMDNIDAYLTWNPRFEEDVPLLPAVYSGYTTYFASPQAEADDLPAFRAAQGRDFLWGCQLGWNGSWILAERHRDKFLFQKKLCDLRMSIKDFQVYGELLGEIKPSNEVPKIRVTWNRTAPHDAMLPAVQGTVWSDKDGNRCYCLVNYSDEPMAIIYDTQLPYRKEGWVLKRVTPSGNAPLAFVENETYRTEYLSAGEICVIEAKPSGENMRKLAKAARTIAKEGCDDELVIAANRFLFERDVNYSVQLLPMFVNFVPGELTKVRYSVGYNIKRPKKGKNEYKIEWPGGKTTYFDLSPNSLQASLGLYKEELIDLNNVEIYDGMTCTVSGKGCEGSLIIPMKVAARNKIDVTISAPKKARGGESFVATLNVRNNSRVAQNAEVILRVPDSWLVEPARSFSVGTLKSMEERCVVVRCMPPASENYIKVSMSALVVQGSTESHVLELLRQRPQVNARKFVKKPVIDGNLSEWSKDGEVRVGGAGSDTVKISKSYSGIDDCSASVRCGWDAENLYIAAVVKDNKHFQKKKDAMIWEGDCLQFALREYGPGTFAGFDGTEREFALSLQNDGGTFAFQWGGGGNEAMGKAVKLTVVRKDGNTVYEAAVPWKEIYLQKQTAGKKMGFSFTVNDNDGDGFKGWLELTPGICGGKDSSAFGFLNLIE